MKFLGHNVLDQNSLLKRGTAVETIFDASLENAFRGFGAILMMHLFRFNNRKTDGRKVA
jgi:hypothetical protein